MKMGGDDDWREHAPRRQGHLIRVEQVADELGVSIHHVRRIIAERRIAYAKVGHLIRFERDEVDRSVQAN